MGDGSYREWNLSECWVGVSAEGEAGLKSSADAQLAERRLMRKPYMLPL
jgi:hypothetical protein